MPNRVPCKFFPRGACRKGQSCKFSHDSTGLSNKICTFYQKGMCSYGSQCRYEHVEVPQDPTSVSLFSANSLSRQAGRETNLSISSHLPALSTPSCPTTSACNQHIEIEPVGLFNNIDGRNSIFVQSAETPICSLASDGNCPRGNLCSHIHGNLCSTCGKHCLHPFRLEEAEVHVRLCLKDKKRREVLRHSQEIECSVCLERVLSKPAAAERKFGLLPECDHPFCISCIRNWRNSSPDSGMDVNSAIRSCPICRKLSYFVVPSVTWYLSKEEKQEIIDGYKSKLRSIDCKHFDFGNGSCPFGWSCFYKHTYRPEMIRPRSSRSQPSGSHTRRPRRDSDTIPVGIDEDSIVGVRIGDSGFENFVRQMAIALYYLDLDVSVGEEEDYCASSDEEYEYDL